MAENEKDVPIKEQEDGSILARVELPEQIEDDEKVEVEVQASEEQEEEHQEETHDEQPEDEETDEDREKIREARKLICSQVRPDEMEEVFRWMYDNLDLFADSDEAQDRAIIIIRNGLVNHSMVADAEINLSATFCELAELQ